jgi:hypothetical protein
MYEIETRVEKDTTKDIIPFDWKQSKIYILVEWTTMGPHIYPPWTNLDVTIITRIYYISNDKLKLNKFPYLCQSHFKSTTNYRFITFQMIN